MTSSSRSRVSCAALLAVALFAAAPGPARAAAILFDATRNEMAGNADWVIDADAFDNVLPAYPCSGSTSESNPQRIPTPPQAGITAATPETYWTGGISAWAVDLAKAGHTIETLPRGARITFNDPGNPQDLSNYKVFIVAEPQGPFTPAEKQAILDFVAAGGGLFMVADHETSDRDCDGWDSPRVFNDLTGATSGTSGGVFGIWFRVDGLPNQGSEDWFDDAVDANTSTDPADPVINGPFGSGAGGLGLFGSTSMDLDAAANPTARGHVWRSGQSPQANLRVTFATARYGAGGVAAVGDSSPADDDTGDPGDTLYPGWDKATGGVKNREIFLNATHWLIDSAPDTTPPVIVSGPSVTPFDCSATVTWITDEAATSVVDHGPTGAYGSTASAPGYVTNHRVGLAPLAPGSTVHYRVSSTDPSGNGPTQSADATFVTAAAAPPVIVSGPAVAGIGSTVATVTWSTDEPSTSEVQYGTTPAYGSSAGAPGLTTAHSVTLAGLTPSTTYHFRALSTDGCSNGPTASGDGTFTTGPPSLDVSGFVLRQYSSAQTFTIPFGTTIPSGGYLVIARDATREAFLATFPGMPADTVFLNSDPNDSCGATGCFPLVNGDETFELYDASSALLDGPTVALSPTHRAFQRVGPGAPAGLAASWNVVDEALATPGGGAGAPVAAGLRINEFADAADFTREFIELYNDAGSAPLDDVPPARVTDLSATPLSDTNIRLDWTAVGDDGTTGTAAGYDIRRAARRILTPGDFEVATPLPGPPAPGAPGTAQQYLATGLPANTTWYFALRVADDAGNRSAPSNDAWATTGVAGGTSPVDHLVISQIRVSGSADDVVEIYNPTGAPVPLTSMSVQYLSAAGNLGFRVNLTAGNSVPSHGWYLVAANGYTGTPARDDSMGTSNMSNSAGHALLVAKTTNVSGCSDAAIVDKVGYGGAASCPEGGTGKQAPLPSGATSITRRPGGTEGSGQDTDVNLDDFLPPAPPVFHNRASAPASVPMALGNVGPSLYLEPSFSGTILRWARAVGATGYPVYRAGTPDAFGPGAVPWQTVPGNATTDTTRPEPGTSFFYVVRATDGTNESEN